MYELTLILHIIAMIGSVALMSGAISLGLLGKTAAVKTATAGMCATLVGFLSGVALLIGAPLSMKCAMLTAYVLSMAALYYVGYGFGDVKKARFVRQTS